jgi:putative ABC transport system permease protein
VRNLRYGARQLRQNPVFTLAAVASLALGIGASVTMFSAFRAVFLRSLPYREPGQIALVQKQSSPGGTSGTTVADVQFLRQHAYSLRDVAWFSAFESATVTGGSEPVDLWVRSVSKNLFPLLGSKPLLGRTLASSDFEPGAVPKVVLSYDTWQKYFHADPNIVGRSIFLSEQYPSPSEKNAVVIGVMPPEFYFPQKGIAAWLPYLTPVTDPFRTGVNIVARVGRGVSIEQARSEIKTLEPALQESYPPADRNWNLSLDSVGALNAAQYRKAFNMLLAAAAFLVLIACLNVANLLLARASARETEFAIRGALGAGWWRLVSQVLTESVALAAIGGACGVGLAYAGNRFLVALLPAYLDIPRLNETRLDVAVLGFAVLLTLVTGLLFGLAPALALSAKRVAAVDRQARSSQSRSRRSALLLVGEVAVSMVLLTGAVLMIRGFAKLANVNPGFETAHVLTAGVPPGRAASLNREQLARRYSEMLRTAAAVPGVEQAALTSALPMGNIVVGLHVYLPGATEGRMPDFHAVSANYFAVMGIPLLSGRLFNDANPHADQGAIVINRAMADQYWPGQDPIGQRLANKPGAPPSLTVVGVVGNTRRRSLSGDAVPEFYQAYQDYFGPVVGTTLVLRTFGSPGTVASSLRRAIHKFDPNQVIENEKTMEATVEQSIAMPRFYTVLLGVFAVLALLLTLVGVYGVASYGVSRRQREFGIRISVGADRRQLVRMIVRQGLRSALIGVSLGACGAWALAHLLSGLVYGIPVKDPVSLSIAAAILLAGALLAYYLPARRSTKVDPAQVLRQE